MNRTYASAIKVKDDNDMSDGYNTCGGDVLDSYNLVSSPEA